MSSRLLDDGLDKMSNILFAGTNTVKLGQSSSTAWASFTPTISELGGSPTTNLTNQTIIWQNSHTAYSSELTSGITLTYFFIYKGNDKVFEAPLDNTVVASTGDMIKIANYVSGRTRGISITVTFT